MRALQLGQRRLDLTAIVHGHGVHIGVTNILRRKSRCAFQRLQSALALSRSHIVQSDCIRNVGTIGGNFLRLQQHVCRRLFFSTDAMQIGQIDVGGNVAGIEPQCLPVSCLRLIKIAQTRVQQTQVDMRMRVPSARVT